jgi:hypothetical protein
MDLNTRRGKTRCDATCDYACCVVGADGKRTVTFCNETYTKRPVHDGDLCEPVCSEIIDAACDYVWRHLGTDTEYARLLNALGGEEALQKARNGG